MSDRSQLATIADTVETLAERLQSSILLEDRRDACRGLRSLARDYRVEVAAQAMEPLVQALKNDRQDIEIAGFCLEALNYIISGDLADSTAAVASEMSSGTVAHGANDPGLELAEIFLKKHENVIIVLESLAETEFRIRWTAVRVLCGLIRHKLPVVQESVLSFPLGVSRLVDLLSEDREVIRNDALLLLIHLTRSNSNIQKIVAFENAFDRLLSIIDAEGFIDGSVVVEDCLIIFLNLLQSNESNQIFFKEGNYIQKFMPFFVATEQLQWNHQKMSIMTLVLQVIDSLLANTNSPGMVSSCQVIMQNCGLLEKLCNMLITNSVPIGVLTETINTASDILRGQLNNPSSRISSTMTMPAAALTPVIMMAIMKELNQDQDRRITELHEYVNTLYNYIATNKNPGE